MLAGLGHTLNINLPRLEIHCRKNGSPAKKFGQMAQLTHPMVLVELGGRVSGANSHVYYLTGFLEK